MPAAAAEEDRGPEKERTQKRPLARPSKRIISSLGGTPMVPLTSLESEMKQLGEETRKALVTTMSKTPLADLANLSSLATKRDERYRLVEKNARAMFKEAASGSGIKAVHGQHILSENLQGDLMDHADVHLSDGQVLRIKKVAKERHKEKGELREQMDELFRVLDEDNDGKLTKDEVLRGAHMIGKTEEEARVLFEQLAVGNFMTKGGAKKFLTKSLKMSITEDDFVKWAMTLFRPTVATSFFQEWTIPLTGTTAFLVSAIISMYLKLDHLITDEVFTTDGVDKVAEAFALLASTFAIIGGCSIVYLANRARHVASKARHAEDRLFLHALKTYHLINSPESDMYVTTA